MAYAIQFTLGTGNKVSLNYQSQEVSLSVTYQLGREETDLLSVVRDKASEVRKAHHIAWERMRESQKEEHQKEGYQQEVQQEEKLSVEPESGVTTDGEEVSTSPGKTASHSPAIAEERLPVPSDSSITVSSLTEGQLTALRALLTQAGWSEAEINARLQASWGRTCLEELTQSQAGTWLVELQRSERQRVQSRNI